MAELVRRSGVRPATIRHYLRLELIPRPDRATRNRYMYDRRHVQALNLIRLLRERRQMSLTEIARILPSLSKMPGEQAFRPEMWDEVLQAQRLGGRESPPAQRLLVAGLSAFTRHGLSEVTVDDLCRLAGLSKGSFYLHYRSKEELFFAAVAAAGDEVSAAFSKQAIARQASGNSSPAGLSEDQAARLLGEVLGERLPLLLELLALAAQHRPGCAGAAQQVFLEVRRAVGPYLCAPSAELAERRVVGDALVGGIRHVIGVIDEHPSEGA